MVHIIPHDSIWEVWYLGVPWEQTFVLMAVAVMSCWRPRTRGTGWCYLYMQQTPALWSASIVGAMSLCIVRVIQLRVGIRMQMSIGAAEVKNRNYPDLNLIENRTKRNYIIPFKQERDGVGSDWLHWPHFKTANTKWQCKGFIQKGFFYSRLSQSDRFLCPYNIVVEWIFLVFVFLCGGLN